MEVLKLQIKNFLSISDVELVPGKINQIVGRNGQGKTSIIKALEFAIKGGADGSLVKFGQENAEVVVELSNDTTIRRKLNAAGKQSLSVTREGFAAPSPQTFVDSLFNEKFSNPLDFLEPKKRTDTILSAIDIAVTPDTLTQMLKLDTIDKLPPLDYAQHGLKVVDQAHTYYYARRAEANKDALAKKNRLDTYRADLAGVKEPEIKKTRAEVQAEVDKAEWEIRQAEADLSRIRESHKAAKAAQERVSKYAKAVDDIDAQIKELEARKAQGMKYVEDARKEVPAALEDDIPTIRKMSDMQIHKEQVKAQFAQADHAETIAKQRAQVEALKNEHDAADKFAKELTWIVDSLAGPVKQRLMSSVEMPVKGLEYRDGQFFVDGVALENMSGSSTIRLAIGIARKLAKKTKLICLDGAEQLDEESYKELRSQVDGDGYTYFLTKVGDAFEDLDSKVVEMQAGKAVAR